MKYNINFNGDIFTILLTDFPSVYDVIKCSKGEFLIVGIEENEDMVDTLVVVQHESVEL